MENKIESPEIAIVRKPLSSTGLDMFEKFLGNIRKMTLFVWLLGKVAPF